MPDNLRVATHFHCWTSTGPGTKDGFDMAREAPGSSVQELVIRVEDLAPETAGEFDLVLFLGVLYHSPDPLRYLRCVRSIRKGQLILETHIDALDYPRPALVFYPGAALANDPTNFWGPNPQAVEQLLKEVGFSRVKLFLNPTEHHGSSRMRLYRTKRERHRAEHGVLPLK